jgi:hypothetical protein
MSSNFTQSNRVLVHLGTPAEQQKTFILDPDSGAVLQEKSYLIVILPELRNLGLAVPWSDVGLVVPWLGVGPTCLS